ncbi:MAG: O-antigen ligase family protein [Deltaproteobacteria bacterium]|jgi:O-antigen ligase|nr:O-antigen ligase family protein [Deltaproteobacteria bacterium]
MRLRHLMTSFFAQAAVVKARLTALHAENPAEFYFGGLFWSFWTTLALFPIGYGWREVMPPVCLLFLLLYYRHAWTRSVLARLTVFPLFCSFWAMLLIGVLFSGHPFDSLLHAGTGINKGFILPFIAMECVREEKDLRRLVWACVCACFWQGMDGVWQAYSGRDFIMDYPLAAGRLTGSIGDYPVGNYIALALIPASALWFILRETYCRVKAALLASALLLPACFLLLGAAARSGMLALAAALGLWWWLVRAGESVRQRWFLPFAGSSVLLMAFFVLTPRGGPLSPFAIAGDGRWVLWEMAWRVFRENLWFGAGAGQYNAAFRSLGLAPAAHDPITISHPHNLYLDMLYAHGLIGFIAGMIFLLGFLYWGYSRIRPGLLAEWRGKIGGLYWRLAAAFWVAYAGWLVNGIFGHDFYRTWWLGLAMSYLGIMAGAVVNGMRHPDNA